MLAVTVGFRITPDHIAEFRNAVLKQADNSLSTEPACRQFDVCFDPTDDQRVFLYEVYDDRPAFDAHLETEHFRAFDTNVADWVEQKEVSVWEIVTH